MMDENWRTIGDMTRRDEMTNKLSESTEKERIRNYIKYGLVGRFDLGGEFSFIFRERSMTQELFEGKFISEERYVETTMVLSARYLRLLCFVEEMFERYPGGA